MKLSLLFAVGLAIGSACLPAPRAFADASLDEMIGEFITCVRRTAARMERSDDLPEDIAIAATVACQALEGAVLNQLLRVKTKQPSPQEIRDAAILFARAQAVAARLCRKVGDCEILSLPAK